MTQLLQTATAPATAEPSTEEEHEHAPGIGGVAPGLRARAGHALADGVRTDMEQAFGADFSGVRVHHGGPEAVGAQAVARGDDLEFADGAYDPDSHGGRELIGHELAHVVQQRQGAVSGPQAKGVQLAGTAALEHEADVAGARAARGERVQVVGAAPAGGAQMKGGKAAPPRALQRQDSRVFLDLEKDKQAPAIAKQRVDELQTRLAAKAELRFTTAEDGQLVARLDAQAKGRVDEMATQQGADDKQKADVTAVSAKIAQRSGAVHGAIGAKSKDVAGEVATAGTYQASFEQAARAAFDQTEVKSGASPKAVIAQAVKAAQAATKAIADAQYTLAQAALDTKLAQGKAQHEQDMTAAARSAVEGRAQKAIEKRGDVDGKLTTIVAAVTKTPLDNLHTEVEKTLAKGIGASGASWWRPQNVRDFRGQMKAAARKQAVTDINAEMAQQAGLGGATKRYVDSDSRIRAYDTAKTSVNNTLQGIAKEGADAVLTAGHVSDQVTAAARQAAFAEFEGGSKEAAAKKAATTATKATLAALHGAVMKASQGWIDQRIGNKQAPERGEIEQQVVGKVTTDEVGKKTIATAIKASSPDEGISKLGKFFDFMVPERGDALSFTVSLEIPLAGAGNLLVDFEGTAERGDRERMLNHHIKPGHEVAERDTSSLKVGTEVRIGYGGSLPGLKGGIKLGFFLRADAATTDMCMKALSYGMYRALPDSVATFLYGGRMSDHRKAGVMSDADPNANKDQGLKDRTYRSELWASMVEEQVFNKDDQARVDIGASLGLAAQANFGGSAGAKAEVGLRAEAMRTYDKKSLSGDGKNTLGDATFDAEHAAERRKNIGGRWAATVKAETSVEVNIAGQAVVFAGAITFAGEEYEIEIGAALKLSTADPASKRTRLYAGIAGAAANVLKSFTGIVRDKRDKDPSKAKQYGNWAGMLTETAQDANAIGNNAVGDALSNAYQVKDKNMDQVIGQGAPSGTHAGAAAETLYRVTILTGHPFKFLVKLDEVQTTTVDIGIANVQYEKTKRVGQVGVTDGRGHGEMFGVSTKT